MSADQASDRTSDVSLRNSNNSRQCGFDLRLGRSSRLSTSASPSQLASLLSSHPSNSFRLLFSRGEQKGLVLLHHHLTDPLPDRRKAAPYGQCGLAIPRNQLSTCLRLLSPAGPHHPPLPPPPPSNEPQTPLPQLEVPAVYHNLAAYN